MKTYELQSAFWTKDGQLEVTYRIKRFFAGSSQPICESMDRQRFVELFGRNSLPPRSRK